MTVSSTNNRVSYTGNGVTTAFSFPYIFFQQADLVVISTIIASGVQTTLTLGTDYTISGAQDASGVYRSGGTVNATTAPPNTVTLTIYRDPSPVQNVQHTDNDDLSAASIDNPLDLLTCIEQRTRDLISRALVQPDGDTSPIARLPAQVSRAGMVLGFDASGNPISVAGASGGTIISSSMIPVVQAASLAAALALLGGLGAGVNTPSSAVTLKSTTTGSAVETFLTLLRNKGAGAANDFLEALAFDGMNASTVEKTFAAIAAQIITATASGEAGALLLRTIVAGTLTTIMTLESGVQIGAPTGGDKGAGTLNAASGLYVAGLPAFPGDIIKLSHTLGASASNPALSAGAWNQAPLNTKDLDTGSNVVSLTSNQFTLAAGTYVIDASSTLAWSGGLASIRLRNTTAGSTLVVGLCGQAATTNGNNVPLRLIGQFTVAASQVLELDVWTQSAVAAGAFAPATGENNVFTEALLTRRA